tara:strand:+ start:993 stop:1238 length:246 start_codon:yes stop_codon:yes gene_type:complete
MNKTLLIELPSETSWVIFVRWIIVSGLVLWSSLFVIGYWSEDNDMMQFNCFNLLAFLGFGISMLLLLIDPTRTAVVNNDDD